MTAFARVPISGALVCDSEVCRTAAIEDAHAISRGTIGQDARELLALAMAKHPAACAYCGAVSFAEYRRVRRGG